MKQLFFLGKGRLEWREVVAPRIEGAQEALVRPFAVAKCDLDNAILAHHLDLKLRLGKALGLVDPGFERHYRNLFKPPFPFGHECVAEVLEVGEQVSTVRVGDVVAVPFQISCGNCLSCRKGGTSHCLNVESVSVYGFGRHKQIGGAMCDLLKVPFADGMLVPIPPHVDPIHLASLADNVADAWRHVGPPLAEDPRRSVLVAGGSAKSIGIYSVLIARALGTGPIAYVDPDESQQALALKVGATTVAGSCAGLRERYDLVVDCCADAADLADAIRRLQHHGTVTSTGWHFRKTRLPLMDMHAIGVTFKVGMSDARTGALEVAKLIQRGVLSLDAATTRLDRWDNAVEAFLSTGNKVIVHRPRLTAAP